jgi:hypothetical protein
MKTETLYQVAKSFIGRDASPKDRADDEYGCADSVNCVFKEAFGKEIGGTVSTYLMYQSLKDETRFKKVSEWKRGCIIISPSNYGNGRIVGHVGICSDDDKIMSNTSSDGIWRENFTILTWIKRYRDLGELPIMFFEPL